MDLFRRKTAAAGAVIFAVTLLAYLPCIHGGILWDDSDYITAPNLRSLHGLWRIWFDVGATEGYYPMMHSAFWLEHRLWGGAVPGYHLTSVFFHAAAACLFGAVLQRLKIPGAYFAALLFALHPVCVESVAWMSEQKNVLSIFFYLLAALAYLRWDSGKALRWYCAAFIFFVAALLSKTVTATLPAGLLLIFWWRRGRPSWKGDVLPLIPWFAVGAAAGLFSAWVERAYFGAEGGVFDLTFMQRLLLSGRMVWFYLGKLLWPANLIFIYPRWHVSAGDWRYYLFLFAALALAAGLILFRKRTRGVLVAYLFFVGSLFPTMGFFNIYGFLYSYVADHWQYLPSLGVFALIGAGLEKAGSRSAVFRFLQIAVLCLLGVLTWRQCGTYSDVETFYRTIIGKNPACWMARNNLGNFLRENGRTREAMAKYEEVEKLKPGAESEYNMGIILADAGRSGEAIAHYKEALRFEPDNSMIVFNLASTLASAGRLPEAIAQYKSALRIEPGFPEAHSSLGLALAATGRLPEALAECEEALRLKPGLFESHFNLAYVFASAGYFPEAVAQYREALRLRPDFAAAHRNLGILLRDMGRNDEGAAELEEAARLRDGR